MNVNDLPDRATLRGAEARALIDRIYKETRKHKNRLYETGACLLILADDLPLAADRKYALKLRRRVFGA